MDKVEVIDPGRYYVIKIGLYTIRYDEEEGIEAGWEINYYDQELVKYVVHIPLQGDEAFVMVCKDGGYYSISQCASRSISKKEALSYLYDEFSWMGKVVELLLNYIQQARKI